MPKLLKNVYRRRWHQRKISSPSRGFFASLRWCHLQTILLLAVDFSCHKKASWATNNQQASEERNEILIKVVWFSLFSSDERTELKHKSNQSRFIENINEKLFSCSFNPFAICAIFLCFDKTINHLISPRAIWCHQTWCKIIRVDEVRRNLNFILSIDNEKLEKICAICILNFSRLVQKLEFLRIYSI